MNNEKKTEKGLGSSPNLTPQKNDNFMIDVFKDYINKMYKMYEPRALTLTLKNKILSDFIEDTEIHKDIYNKIRNSRLWKKVTYIIRPEYTELGRLHYHAIVFTDDITKLSSIVKWWRRNFGYVNRDWNKEIKYCVCPNFKRYNNEPCIWQKKIKNNNNIKIKFELSHCWSHYLFKDYNKTKLWTIYKLNS